MEEALDREKSKSFHSVIVGGEKSFSKNLCITFIIGIPLAFLNYLVFLQKLIYKDTMKIDLYRFCKMNLIFSTYACFARTLNPIYDSLTALVPHCPCYS